MLLRMFVRALLYRTVNLHGNSFGVPEEVYMTRFVYGVHNSNNNTRVGWHVVVIIDIMQNRRLRFERGSPKTCGDFDRHVCD